jgi:hypothetical protein
MGLPVLPVTGHLLSSLMKFLLSLSELGHRAAMNAVLLPKETDYLW